MELLTVSVDSLFSHRAWAEQENFQFSLLADFWPHGAVAKQYGVFDEARGLAIRGTFVIDKQGVVRWSVVNPIPQARDIADYQKALSELALSAWWAAEGRLLAPRPSEGRELISPPPPFVFPGLGAGIRWGGAGGPRRVTPSRDSGRR